MLTFLITDEKNSDFALSFEISMDNLLNFQAVLLIFIKKATKNYLSPYSILNYLFLLYCMLKSLISQIDILLSICKCFQELFVSNSFLQKITLFYRAMRVKRVSKTILIEQQTTPDKRSKTLPPKILPKANLRNIIEVTEQNQPNPVAKFSEKCGEVANQQNQDEQKPSCFSRYTGCLVNLWRFTFKRSPKLEIDMNDSDLNSIIQKIKNKKTDYAPLLPPQKTHKKVLILDLDETLIHTTFTKPLKYDFQSQVVFNGKNTKIYTVKRFGLDSFLFEMSKLYELIIFTASQKLYADRIIDMIDPKKRISHRLYREHCFIINKTYFLKNIRSIGRNTKDIVIVDDNNIAGLLQPENFYKIEPFEGNEKDRQLCRLSAFLKYLHEKQNINSVKQEWREFQDLEIVLSESDSSSMKSSINEGRSLIQRKKTHYNHRKRNSEIENLVTKSTEDENQGEISASDFIKKL